ncbi:hypothetical protein CP556_24640 [Natrinema sp. CBA1119]|uniref:hypothetical protein n=1 Tax=Natrinema sp. CBA1119 TaxID=1608465 RepID=UPI000BFA9C8A|nr:hypothetical protein [Natrinema sp. CBA1119]PGF14205.1 hypothetical protein CP556_24640 [Natrinema sp. CBA1119]
MPPTIVLIVIAVLVGIALVYGYRTLTALLVLRSLSSGDVDRSPAIVDGEPIALTGELVVEEPVKSGDAAVEDTDRSVGAYLWRARHPDNTNSDLTIDEWGWERQHWHTFASGIEWGRFGVAADGQTVYIDPSWLQETTGSEPLEDLTIGGITNTERFSTYLWDRWYTYLRDHTEHRSLRRFVGHVQRHNDDVDLDRYLLEARPLLEGTSVSISGELHVYQGEPVLRGTDDIPILLSDEGFDGHRRWLRQQALRKGVVAVGVLAVAISLWFEFYVPLAVLIVGYLIYVGYHFIKDVNIFLEFLERLRN